MDPEFPVFLPRLAELIEEEKELTESALKFVLQRSPDIGKYDSLSQVLKFSKPEEAHSMIDNLLQSYKDRTFEELIVLMECDCWDLLQNRLKRSCLAVLGKAGAPENSVLG